MIGFIRGKLVTKTPPLLVLDVQGVGYEIEAPMTTFYNLPPMGETVHLHTHLVVREDAHILFGFSTEADRVMFRALIKVNGVGPKLALTILSGQSADEFHRCIQDNDTAALIRLPGVGKKTAERLIIEMRDKLPARDESSIDNTSSGQGSENQPRSNAKQEAISALCALGYKAQDASKMVQGIAQEDKSCEDIIRLALQGKAK
ncbi:Holliday junction DNA helicase RuvA [Bathymodiolus platifrons methanotrophic gill symbiont]|uniref:Holliday junction branch migration protein RuvA n=1 Tax=Bathymodiolus platifrons methanotrophic gill symbiont TaxID=113268 RepID=UPI0011CB5186|nr:Holliday junction branch migration protein RuvA [Bathymodiolus platifrons methanotrophic gill symbiont]MCK5870247.1 Holliday junction branch migration protein RuvA [Methyloprofundus sp.]TXK94818.1 Holliday junction branch migration protein RuvA [Methylococcaceae bacterium CS4]TXL01350.1 Holliday junction branch migration protein RuvA [Methylococcaceae bacterium CS5]TXL01944.1 Holliday junction branch migration protein RuvA [Methylococcaceae bacterium HT1]TXL03683.1 Holliday junction branch 